MTSGEVRDRKGCPLTSVCESFHELRSFRPKLPLIRPWRHLIISIHELWVISIYAYNHSQALRDFRNLSSRFVCRFISLKSVSHQIVPIKENYTLKSFSLMDFSIDVRYFILISVCFASSSLPASWCTANLVESWENSSRILFWIFFRASLVSASST